jgi:hypothetical protein
MMDIVSDLVRLVEGAGSLSGGIRAGRASAAPAGCPGGGRSKVPRHCPGARGAGRKRPRLTSGTAASAPWPNAGRRNRPFPWMDDFDAF